MLKKVSSILLFEIFTEDTNMLFEDTEDFDLLVPLILLGAHKPRAHIPSDWFSGRCRQKHPCGIKYLSEYLPLPSRAMLTGLKFLLNNCATCDSPM